jgi:hypothetical protein
MRTVHDRYHPSRRNPFSEIEYSDHYSRAMSAYSVYLAEGTFEPVRIVQSGNSSEIIVQFINPIIVKAGQTLTVRVDW